MVDIKKLFIKAFDEFEKKQSEYRKKASCMVSSCDRKAINSHSQQENGQLSHISNADGEVYALRDSMAQSFNPKDGNVNFLFKKIHISRASTYIGLCNLCDTKIFAAIEKEDLCIVDTREALAFLFRSISYETARNKRELLRYEYVFEQVGNVLIKRQYLGMSQQMLFNKVRYSISRNKLNKIESLLNEGNSHSVKHCHIKLPRNIGVSCSSLINMNLGNASPFAEVDVNYGVPTFSFNVLPKVNKTHIILSWLSEDDEYMAEVIQYCKLDMELILNRLIFCESEDICISPELWESFSENQINLIMNNMRHHIYRGELNNSSVHRAIEIKEFDLII